MTKLHVVEFPQGDEREYLALHNRAFGPPVWDAAWFAWRYRHPLGRPTRMLGAFDDDGRCRTMYGAVLHPLRLARAESSALCFGDVAIDPDLRRGLGAHRTLVAMARRLIQEHFDAGGDIAYGFPEPALRRVTQAQYGAQHVADVSFLLREPEPLTSTPADLFVEPARLDAVTDELCRRCMQDHDTAIVRDVAYLRWRYAAHPRVSYRLLEARGRDGSTRGLCVLRVGGVHPEVASLMEWLVPEGDEDAEQTLLAAALAFARENRAPYLLAWFSPAAAALRRFQVRHRFFVQPSPYELCARWSRSFGDRDRLHMSWYLSLGDVEFF